MYKACVEIPNISEENIYGDTLLEVKEKVNERYNDLRNFWVNVTYECDGEYIDSEEVFIDKDGNIEY